MTSNKSKPRAPTGVPRSDKTPIKDPLYRQILAALGDRLDPDVFEQCANDLLRRSWPTIAPVPGGNDGGRDGVVSDDGPFLVCTTSGDVSSNLRGSLESHKQTGKKSRATIVATSAAVTPQQRATLERVATDQGYELRNVYQRVWFADALYANTRWRRELLGIAGDAPVLSAVSLGWRSRATELVGREAEIARLHGSPADAVVAGQPGSGKTALLAMLVERGGLFVVDHDLGRIANACRELKPTAVIVDDAAILRSFDVEFLARLRHLRGEMGAGFRIVAATWPTEARQVADALGVDDQGMIELERLTRDQIVQLLNKVGLKGPNYLVRLVVDQAEGLAGLATFLAEAVLSGKGEEVFTGDIIAARTYATIDRLLSSRARYVLGVLALGGDAGMPPQEAARLLGMSVPDYYGCVAGLAAGGIIRETSFDYQKTHAVFPKVLRWVLVRDMFFKGPPPVAYKAAAAAVPSPIETTKVLVGAQSRGANVPDLRDRVVAADTKDVWAMYAWRGRNETLFVLEHDRQALDHVVEPALRYAPDRILPVLFDAAVEERRGLSSLADHPLQQIERWSEHIDPVHRDYIDRRESLLRAVERWNVPGDEARATVALQAIHHALAPSVNGTEYDPGGGHTLTITRGLLAAAHLGRLGEMWPRALQVILAQRGTSWKPVFDLIRSWSYPSDLVPETQDSMKAREAMIERMLTDLARASQTYPGIQHRLKELADFRSLPIKVALDPEYEELFPQVGTRVGEIHAIFDTSAKAFADRYVAAEPTAVASRLIALEKEAKLADHSWPHLAHRACATLAAQVRMPLAWFRSFRAAGCASGCGEPFLLKAAEEATDDVKRELTACLTDSSYAATAIGIILSDSRWPEELVERAIEKASDHSEVVNHLSLLGKLPLGTFKRMLESDSQAVRTAAIEGRSSNPEASEIEPMIRDAWRSAVLRMGGRSHLLVGLLQRDEQLARKWIAARIALSRTSYLPFEDEATFENVASILPRDVRRELLASVTADAKLSSEAISALLGDDVVAYRALLANPDMKAHHLCLLECRPDQRWPERAKFALEAGYPTDRIAAASFTGGISWSGSEYEFWRSWQKDFEDLEAGAEEVCRPILIEGARLAANRAEYARKRQQQEDTYGGS